MGEETKVIEKKEETAVVKTEVEALTGLNEKQIALIKRTVAKGATNDQLAMFMHIAKKYELDPFTKEIWFYKDKKGNCLMYTSRDGYLKIAHRSGEFDGIKSGAVRKKDGFQADIQNNKVDHIIRPTEERGALVGGWATAYRKGCEAVTVYVDFATYNKGYNTWKSHPDSMIQKVAENIALKRLFGIAGLTTVEEKDSITKPKKVEAKQVEQTDWQAKLKAEGVKDEDMPETQEEAQKQYAKLLQDGNGK